MMLQVLSYTKHPFEYPLECFQRYKPLHKPRWNLAVTRCHKILDIQMLSSLHICSQTESRRLTSDIRYISLASLKTCYWLLLLSFCKARTTGQAPVFHCVHQQLDCSLPLSASSAGTDSCTAGHIISLQFFLLKIPQKFNGPFPFLSFFTGADRRIVADQIIGLPHWLIGLTGTKKPKNVQSSLPLASFLAGT